jgi:Flp pilus assembly protein TadB
MILPEVLISQNRFLKLERRQKEDRLKSRIDKHTGMTVNVLTTMAVSFVVAAVGLWVLAAGSTNQAIVGGVLAMAAGFINLLRRPPEEAKGCE